MPKLPSQSSSPRIYFAFPDRTYDYSCATCDAICCRGHGIGTTPKETPLLLKSYPELGAMARRSSASGADFTNPTGACFFLTPENLCRIEKEHGKGAKPGVCVLFPFNDFSRLGNAIIVRPHFLCPLTLRPGKGVGVHAEIEQQMRDTGMLARAMAQPEVSVPEEKVRDLLEREREFRDRCAERIGAGSFEALLREESDAGFLRWQKRVLKLWGVGYQNSARDEIDDILLALAPPLRMHLIHMSEKRRLRILFLAGVYVRNAARLSSQPLSLQGAHHLIVSVLPVLRLLARGNVSLSLSASVVEQGVEFQNPTSTVAFFQIIEELQAGKRLYDSIECALPQSLSGMERAIFFHQLALRLRELARKKR